VLDFDKIVNTEERRCVVEALGSEGAGQLPYLRAPDRRFGEYSLRKELLTPTELALKTKEIEACWDAGRNR
jgi:hypothetical protein